MRWWQRSATPLPVSTLAVHSSRITKFKLKTSGDVSTYSHLSPQTSRVPMLSSVLEATTRQGLIHGKSRFKRANYVLLGSEPMAESDRLEIIATKPVSIEGLRT